MSNKHQRKIENSLKQLDSLINNIFQEAESIDEVEKIHYELDTSLSIAFGTVMEKSGYIWDESEGEWTLNE